MYVIFISKQTTIRLFYYFITNFCCTVFSSNKNIYRSFVTFFWMSMTVQTISREYNCRKMYCRRPGWGSNSSGLYGKAPFSWNFRDIGSNFQELMEELLWPEINMKKHYRYNCCTYTVSCFWWQNDHRVVMVAIRSTTYGSFTEKLLIIKQVMIFFI